jgi:hypothetical protein
MDSLMCNRTLKFAQERALSDKRHALARGMTNIETCRHAQIARRAKVSQSPILDLVRKSSAIVAPSRAL